MPRRTSSVSKVVRALTTAERHELVGWRLRILNELGTIDMLRAADGARLRRVYESAMAVGALEIAAGVAVNIVTRHAMRAELDSARSATRTAHATALALGLSPLAAAALVIEAITHGFQGNREEMERLLNASHELTADDADLNAFALAAGRGLCALVREERVEALLALRQAAQNDAVGSLDAARGPLLLVLAASGTAAKADLDAAHETATPEAAWSELWCGYGEAALAGHDGDRSSAEQALATAEPAALRYPLFRAIGLRLLAEAALRDGWGDPVSRLRDAEASFVAGGQDRIAGACRHLLRQPGASTTRRRGTDRTLPVDLLRARVTAREAEVLDLVAERLSNREIAARLYISPRTVEKHVASLLVKLVVDDRAGLVARGAHRRSTQNGEDHDARRRTIRLRRREHRQIPRSVRGRR